MGVEPRVVPLQPRRGGLEYEKVFAERLDSHDTLRRISLDIPIGGSRIPCIVRKEEVVEERETIRAERGSDYGPVLSNHESIGMIWGGILGQARTAGRWFPGDAIPPELVCLMMVGVKMSREAFRHKKDNGVDARNYLDFVEELSNGL